MSDKAVSVSQEPTDPQIAEIRLWAENDADIMQHDPRRDILFLLEALDTARLASEGETAQLRQRVEQLERDIKVYRDAADNLLAQKHALTDIAKAAEQQTAQAVAEVTYYERLYNPRTEHTAKAAFAELHAAKEAAEATIASIRELSANLRRTEKPGVFSEIGLRAERERIRCAELIDERLASIPAPAPRTEEQP